MFPSRDWRAAAVVSVVAGVVLGASCERPYLTWTPREPLAARRGRLAITVEDRRQGDHRSLGRVVGWGGASRELVVDADHVRARMEQLARTAAVTAGLGLAAPAETPSARLALAVSQLRCDGTGLHARAELEVTMAINAADGAQMVPAQMVAARAKAGSCEAALEKTLDELLDELAARLLNAGNADNRETGTGDRQQATGNRQPSDRGADGSGDAVAVGDAGAPPAPL